MTAAGAPRGDHWLARTALAIGGGYWFASAAAACLALLLTAIGIAPPQAAMGATLASLILYLGAALYAFTDRTPAIVAATLIGGGAALGLIALLFRAVH